MKIYACLKIFTYIAIASWIDNPKWSGSLPKNVSTWRFWSYSNASFLVCVVIVFERPLAGVFISIILLLDGGGISVASGNNFFFKLPSSIISFKSRPLWKKKSAVIQQCFSFFFYNFFFCIFLFFFIDKNKQRPASSIVFQNKRTCFTLKKN